MKSRVSSKGQITLPVEVRLRLGLSAGTPVRFELKRDAVILRKGAPGVHPVDRLYGRLDLGKPVDAVLDEMRGPRPRASGRPRPRARRARP
jgi:AbrB family looped-hinge helix DNA binding protein